MGRIQPLPVNARPAPRDAGLFLRSRHRIPEPRPDVRSRPTEFRRRAAQSLESLHPSGRYQRKGTERAMDD